MPVLLRYLFAFFPAIIQTTAIAQITGNDATLTGTVVEGPSKKALPVATLVLESKSKKRVAVSAITSEKGSFSLSVADTGVYQLHITYTGFKEQVLGITIAPGFSGWHLGTISLQPGSGTLAEVIIKTDRPMVEQKADRLVYNAERDLSTLGGTAADVLRNVPMLSVDGDGNVQLRGTSNIRVLINNKPSSLIAVSVADALRQLPAEIVKTVEVITSPGAKYDAEGTAGVINIITKKNLLQGVTGSVILVPGNVSTIGNAGLNFRRPKYGLNFSAGMNQFYNTGNSFLQRRDLSTGNVFTQQGKTKNRRGFVSPRIGFDWSVNERNTISGGFAYNPAHNTVRNRQALSNVTSSGVPFRQSTLDLLNSTRDAGFDYNFEYLRTFKNPQKEFSLLMLYSISNADNRSEQDEFNAAKALIYQQRNTNQSQNAEATIQADYTLPLKNKSLIEVGGKSILRKAESVVRYNDIFPVRGDNVAAENIFSYTQNVWSGYLSYAFNLGEVQVKTGVRWEGTGIDAVDQTKNFSFSTYYQNAIPALNASYTFNEKHSLRLGFTQRLQRPQLFYLNPYREVIAPQIIRQGNPTLDAERASLYEIGYGTYAPKFSVNASVYARTTNNAITPAYSLENDTTYIRFFNIAANKTYGTNVSGNYKPTKNWSLNGNANVYYVKLTGNHLSNSGWMYNLFVSSNVDLGKGWSHGFTGSFNSRRVALQGRIGAFYYHNTTIRKTIWNKRGSLGINLANPLMKGTRLRNDLITATFEQLEDDIDFTRGVRLSFSYRFGKLQQQSKAPRKPTKNIVNDDAIRGQ